MSLYVMAGWHLVVLGTPGRVVFDVLYHSDLWQQIFAIDNSFILWGLALGFALWRRIPWLIALTGAALLHLALDFPLHNHDARMHFWPLTDWKFISPISYWQPSRGGRTVEMVEMTLVAVLTVWLLIRYKSWQWRAVFAAIGLMQIAPMVMWRMIL
ncbi:MAG: cobalamin biosynthesis protein CobQ [Pseudomonadota bacterium]